MLEVAWETDGEGGHGCWSHGPGNQLRQHLDHLIEDGSDALQIVPLGQWPECKAGIAAASWQSILGQDMREPGTWRFTWEAVTSELQSQVRAATAKAGRL